MVCIKSVLFYYGRKTKNNLSDMKARSVHRVLLPSLANAPEGTARSVACPRHDDFTVNIIYTYKYISTFIFLLENPLILVRYLNLKTSTLIFLVSIHGYWLV